MKFTEITSLSNPIIREAFKIKEKRSKYKNEAFLIEGPHLIEMATASPTVEIKKVFFCEGFFAKRDSQRLLRHISKRDVQLIKTSEDIISRLADTETPQGIAAIVSYKMVSMGEVSFKGIPFLVICEGIQDPGNLGTIIRTADAAGADAVIILPGTCDAFMSKSVRSTAGSLFNISIVYSNTDQLFKYLRLHNIELYATDVYAKTLIYGVDFKRPSAIAFGSEAHGVSEVIAKTAKRIKIPIIGKAESLNVAMAASICLYEVVRQRY